MSYLNAKVEQFDEVEGVALDGEALQRQREDVNMYNMQSTYVKNTVSMLGSSSAGQKVIASLLERVSSEFSRYITNAKAGRAVASRKHFIEVCDKLTPDVLAVITLRRILNACGGKTTEVNAENALQISDLLGSDLHDEYLRVQLKNANPLRYRQFNEDMGSAKSSKERIVRLERIASHNQDYSIDTSMTVTASIALGGHCLNVAVTALPEDLSINSVTRRRAKGKGVSTEITVQVSETILTIISEDITAAAALITPSTAMVCPPRPWTDTRSGGYLTRRSNLYRGRGKEGTGSDDSGTPETVLDAINNLQEVPLVINTKIYTLLKAAYDDRNNLNGVLPAFSDEKIDRLQERLSADEFRSWISNPENAEEYTTWRHRAAHVHKKNRQQLPGQRRQVISAVAIGGDYSQYGEIYFPWSMDTRSRAYPMATEGGITPQGCGVAKGLITFKNKKPLTAAGVKWLRIGLANEFGKHKGVAIDKLSFKGREKWAIENETLIITSATDPETYTAWTQAENPWMFLALAIEYSNAKSSGNMETYASSAKVGLDGTCNGLQHYSALLRSTVEARFTNLIDQEVPSDIYTETLVRILPLIREAAATASAEDLVLLDLLLSDDRFLTRKHIKRPVMTTPYSVTLAGMQDQIFKDLLQEDSKAPLKPLILEYGYQKLSKIARLLAQFTWVAVGEVVPGAKAGQEFFKELAGVCNKYDEILRWTTPDGLVCANAYKYSKKKRVRTEIGGAQIRFEADDSSVPLSINTRRAKSAIAPNVIHSLDATHMRLVINACKEEGIELIVVHDSYSTHACDVERLSVIIREQFHKLYSKETLSEIHKSIITNAVKPETKAALRAIQLPALGDFDIAQVLTAKFLFS